METATAGLTPVQRLFPHVEPDFMGVPLWMVDPQLITPALEEWERGMAERHLGAYAVKVMGMVPALHHAVICAAIDDLLADCYDELIILAPPGSAKSSYTSHALGAYFMGRFPDRNIILGTHTSELSERWSRKVRATFSSPEHQLVFPDSALSKDSTAVSRWATSRGGELLAAGVGGSILGFRADLGVIDDPISGFEQAQSMTQLAKVHEWYETDFVTRLKPNAKVVLICQRLARNDLAGYLIDRNAANPTRRQRVLTLPMLAEHDDPVGRQPGERLWPEWFTAEMVEDARRDDFKWRTLYQQQPPSDTGAWVSPDEIRFVDIAPVSSQTYMATDIALSVNSGDYSVHIVASMTPQADLVIVDAWRGRTSPEQTASRHIDMCDTYSPKLAGIDDDNASKVYAQLLARMARERGVPVPWRPYPMRGQDKETRAAAIRGWFKRGKVYLVKAEWNRWLVNEILGFPNLLGDGVDDGIDCLSILGRMLSTMSAPSGEKPPAPPAKTWQDVTLNEMWDDRDKIRRNRRI